MYEDAIRDYLKSTFIIVLLIILCILGFKLRENRDSKSEYTMETYYDEDLEIRMIIMKDADGQVIYCEREDR